MRTKLDTNIRADYKKTKIGRIPEEWTLVSFGDIVSTSQYGLSLASSENGTVPIFKMNNFNNGKMSSSNLDMVEINAEELSAFKLNKGDILFNRTNSYDLVGKTALFDLEGDFVFASYLVRFRINKKKAEPEYVNFFFNWEATQKRIRAIATKGVSQVNINPTSLKKWLKIPLPPLPEQRKIAQILSTWDKAIELTEKLIAAKERRKKGLMQQLLTGQTRFHEFVQKREFKSTIIGQIPCDWEVKRLEEVAQIDKEILSSNTPGDYSFI